VEELAGRKLAVILHADIVGSTNLVQQNETLAHTRIQGVFKNFSATISRYGGITRELRGDALVAEFDRASDAVCASLDYQAGSAPDSSQPEENSPDIRPQLRIGIALGEVVIADNTITGAGVVLAQRLEQLAQPGGVCIQAAASETIPRRMPFHFENLGERQVKGFDEPVRVFSISLDSGEAVPPPENRVKSITDSSRYSRSVRTAIGLTLLMIVCLSGYAGFRYWALQGNDAADVIEAIETGLPSIAVLPFDNLSQDPEQNYFADGLADDLITDLSKISGLIVTARNSSFSYRDQELDIAKIAVELGVRYLLNGSVRRSDLKIRINARLVDTVTGNHIWSERYDQDLVNVFDIQDQVTRKIVAALKVNLKPGDEKKNNPKSFDAYDMLLRALEVQARFTPQDNAEGRELFKNAALLDPEYARAHAGVALTHAIDINMNWTSDRARSIELGLLAVNKALELNDDAPRAYFAKGAILLAQRKYDESLAAMRHVVELVPNYADGYAQFAFVLVNSGQHEEGLQAIQRARRLNPHFSQLYLYVESMALFHLERYEEAAALLIAAVERNPAFDRAQLLLASAYGHMGKLEEAEWILQEAALLSANLSLDDEESDSILSRERDRERYIEGLRLAGLGSQGI